MDAGTTLTRPAWLDRFAMQLGALVPAMDPQVASDFATSAYVDAFDLSPEEAAQICALELPPLDVGE
jgi:hypothetical protein